MLLLLFNQAQGPTYTLSCDAVTFSLTGQDAELLYNRVLRADNASFTLTGQDATLTYTPVTGYTLDADAGTFNFVGQDATLVYSGGPTPAPGIVTGGGQHLYPTKPKAKSSKQLLDELLDEVDKVVEDPKELLEVTTYPELVSVEALRDAFVARKRAEEEEEDEAILLLA